MNNIKKFIQEASVSQIVTWVGIGVFICLALYSALFRLFDHDEFEALHSSWLVFSGQTIYVDFLQHHHFLWYYVLTPLFTLFGEGTHTIIAARLLSLALTLGIALLVYRIAALVYSRQVGILSVFFLLTTITFVDKSIEIRPDVPLVFFELLSVLFLLQYFQSRKVHKLILSALALFVAFLCLQKAVFLGFLVGTVMLYKIYHKQMPWRDFFAYATVWAVLIALFGWYVSRVFGLEQYFFLNWQLNTVLLNTFPLYKYLSWSLVQNPLLWGLFILALGLAAVRKERSVITFIALGLLSCIFLTKSPFPQYYLMSLPFIAIVAANAFMRLPWVAPRFQVVLLSVSLVWSVGAWWYMYDGSNVAQLARVQYVLDVTQPTDLVYDGDAQFNIFRKDIGYFWFSLRPKNGVLTSYRLLREYPYNTYESIAEKKPKIISDSFISTKNPAVRDFYTESTVFEGLYIRNN